jgi:hypothetical protein
MPGQLQIVTVDDLGGGVNNFNRPNKIGPNEMVDRSRNVRGDAEFCIPRNGYVTVFDTLAGSTAGVKLLTPYLRNADTNDRLISVYNNKIYRTLPGTDTAWSEITQSFITSTANINAISYYDWLFLMNGVDKPVRIEGTTATQPFTKPDSFASANDFIPAFGDVYNGSLVVSGVPSRPNVVYVSKASTSASEGLVYDFSGTLSGDVVDANEFLMENRVTSIRKLSSALVIFTVDGATYVPGLKEFSTAVLFDRQPIGGAQGAVSHKSTCVVENDIYYLTQNKEIRSIRRGFADSLSMITIPLSINIQRFLTDEIDDDLSTAFSFYNNKEHKYYLYLRKKGSTMNTVRIIADIDRVDQNGVPSWYIDEDIPMQTGCVYEGTNYTGSTVLGQVYQDGVGYADDDDASILTIRSSKDFDANNPMALKMFKYVTVFTDITQSTEMTVRVFVDDVLYKEVSITAEDISSGGTTGGIGTQSVGDFAIGDETEDTTAFVEDFFEIRKRIPIRRRGKKIRIDVLTDGTNNSYRLRQLEYGFLALSRLQAPVSEK